MFIPSLPLYVLGTLVDGARFEDIHEQLGQPSALRCLIPQTRGGTPADIGLKNALPFVTCDHQSFVYEICSFGDDSREPWSSVEG